MCLMRQVFICFIFLMFVYWCVCDHKIDAEWEVTKKKKKTNLMMKNNNYWNSNRWHETSRASLDCIENIKYLTELVGWWQINPSDKIFIFIESENDENNFIFDWRLSPDQWHLIFTCLSSQIILFSSSFLSLLNWIILFLLRMNRLANSLIVYNDCIVPN